MVHYRLRIRNAKVVAVVANGERYLAGKEAMNSVAVFDGHSVVVGTDGRIAFVGPAADMDAKLGAGATFDTDLDGTGKCVLPGFVDGHTHPVFAGDRAHEFVMKLNGATYMEVAAAGGGIGFTTDHVHKASEAELLTQLKGRLDRMARHGTTTIEGKSGYGLETEAEMKMLRVLHTASKEHPIDIVSNFCGAHAVPKGKTSEEATVDVIEKMIPRLVEEKAKGLNSAEMIDVFCETGVFSREETRRILEAGKRVGLAANFHGDELSCLNSGELAGEVGALGVSHLEHITPEGIAAMAKGPSFAVLLPVTAYVLRIEPPPARKIIDGGVPVALGSDLCPNAHSMSMPFTMNLACVLMRMTPSEALIASTINSAASINRSDSRGSIEVGKLGDLVLLDAPLWEHVVYQMVDPPIEAVFKEGKRMFGQ